MYRKGETYSLPCLICGVRWLWTPAKTKTLAPQYCPGCRVRQKRIVISGTPRAAP